MVHLKKRGLKRFALLFLSCSVFFGSKAQTGDLPVSPNLNELISFALKNKISVKQSNLAEEIGEREIRSFLSGWLPQINANGSYNHNLKIPTSTIGDQNIQMGQKNNFSALFQLDQTILDPSMLQASRASKYLRTGFEQDIESEKINTVVDISKAYFDILTTEKQLDIIEENITRLKKQFGDAKARYETGMVDKTDYKRARISLNNAEADLKKTAEIRKAKYDFLKQLLNIPQSRTLELSADIETLELQVPVDTSMYLNPENRIEYRQIANIKELQKVNTQYHKWNFLPRVGAFANYQASFRDNNFGNMFSQNFPSSVLGLSINIPIFQGGKRIHELRRSELMEKQIDYDLEQIENAIHSEYSTSMANYKANLIEWTNAKENVELSEEVYETIKLQYDAGIKTYLDLMTAETDLRTSSLNYLNALYSVLASKIDVQKSLGAINIDR